MRKTSSTIRPRFAASGQVRHTTLSNASTGNPMSVNAARYENGRSASRPFNSHAYASPSRRPSSTSVSLGPMYKIFILPPLIKVPRTHAVPGIIRHGYDYVFVNGDVPRFALNLLENLPKIRPLFQIVRRFRLRLIQDYRGEEYVGIVYQQKIFIPLPTVDCL